MKLIHDSLGKTHPRRIILAALPALCVLLASCSEPDYVEVSVYPVSGKLTVGGEPAHGAYITFHPDGDVGMTKGNRPFARADKDGRFTVTTYETGDGAPAGDYLVTVYWPEDPEARGYSPDRLKGRYARPEKSTLRATIRPSNNPLPVWNLE